MVLAALSACFCLLYLAVAWALLLALYVCGNGDALWASGRFASPSFSTVKATTSCRTNWAVRGNWADTGDVTAYFNLSSYLYLSRLIYDMSLIIPELSVLPDRLYRSYTHTHAHVNAYRTYPLSRYSATILLNAHTRVSATYLSILYGYSHAHSPSWSTHLESYPSLYL